MKNQLDKDDAQEFDKLGGLSKYSIRENKRRQKRNKKWRKDNRNRNK